MIRSALYWLWFVITVIPYALVLIVLSIFVRGNPPYKIAAMWLRQMTIAAHWIAGVKYRLHGLENMPSEESMEPIILCPKHQSTWETFALPALMSHPLAFVFKRELLFVPVFGWALGRLDMVHINRSKRAEAWNRVAQQGGELMKRGVWIIMFPEGTRRERGKQGGFKTGASRLAIATGASIIPIAVTSARCWPRASMRLTPGVIELSIGKPISSIGREPDELMHEVETWVEAEMLRLDPEAY